MDLIPATIYFPAEATPVRLLPGDRRDSCASCCTCSRLGVLGGRLAGDVHGAYAPHSGGLCGSRASFGSPRADLPARTGRSRSATDHTGRRWPDFDELPLLSSRAVAAYQTDIRIAANRSARTRGHENQSIRHRTYRAATERSTNAGDRDAVPVSVHSRSDAGWSGLSDLNSREVAELVCSAR